MGILEMTVDGKARHAQNILTDPLFMEAIEVIREENLNAIANSLPDDQEKREHHYQIIQGAAAFVDHLKSYLDDASIAAKRSS